MRRGGARGGRRDALGGASEFLALANTRASGHGPDPEVAPAIMKVTGSMVVSGTQRPHLQVSVPRAPLRVRPSQALSRAIAPRPPVLCGTVPGHQDVTTSPSRRSGPSGIASDPWTRWHEAFCRAKGHQDFKASGNSYAQVLVSRPQFVGDVVEDEAALASVLPLEQVEDNVPWGKKRRRSVWRRCGGHQRCCG